MLGKCDMVCKNHLLLNPLHCQELLGRDCKQDEKLEHLYVVELINLKILKWLKND